MIEMTDSVNDLLTAWDSGDTIWSVELGGLGPGYEQAIQIAAVEIARKLRHYKPTGTKEEQTKYVDKICYAVIHNIDKELGGLSGAMVDQAKWLAWQWCHNGGPKHLIERAKKKGHETIQVSKAWPKSP